MGITQEMQDDEERRARAIADAMEAHGDTQVMPEAIDYGLPIVATAVRPHPLIKSHPGTRVQGLVVRLKTYRFVQSGDPSKTEPDMVRCSPEEYQKMFAGAENLRQRNVDLTADGRRAVSAADKAWKQAHR